MAGLIPEADDRLTQWARDLVGDAAEVSLAPPRAPSAGKTSVGLYLLEVLEQPPPRNTKRPPLQLSLRYLVTVSGSKEKDAHALFEHLVFAAMENPELEVQLPGLPLEGWTAFGCPPQPSFTLKLPVRRERPEHPARRVTEVVVDTLAIRPLVGVVLGPKDIAIAGAAVELPALGQSTRTDRRGGFRFGALPAGRKAHVRVRARGFEQELDVDPGDTQVIIRFESMED